MKKARVHSVEFKEAAVSRMKAGENVSELARTLKVRRKLLYEWKAVLAKGQRLRARGRPKEAQSDKLEALKEGSRIEELERLVGQLTVENRFFKGALRRIEELRRSKDAPTGAASMPRSRQ
jgi:transposase-like protein